MLIVSNQPNQTRVCAAEHPQSHLPLHWSVRVMLLAAAYFLTGKFGSYLAIPPGYATSIWPPSGIALAGILIFGYQAWLGVFLGSFLVNVSISLASAATATNFDSVLLTLVISSGASLQALCGAYLVKRCTGFPNPLIQESKIFLFFLCGGLISTLLNASLAVFALLAAGRIPAENFLTNWATWWLGDSLGVFIFAPLMLVWNLHHTNPWLGRRWIITLPVLAMFTLTTTVVYFEAEHDRERIKLEFDQNAAQMYDALQNSLLSHVNVLRSLASFYASSTQVDNTEFRSFVAHTLTDFQGIQALEWSPVIRAADRSNFEERMRQTGYPQFQITELDANLQRVVAGQHPEYVPVTYIEPFENNAAALGYDLYSNAVRRRAIEMARDSGEISATSRIKLVQETDHQYGLLAFLPVYRPGANLETQEQRHKHIQGYVLAVFRGGDIVNNALRDLTPLNLAYRLVDANAPASEQLIFSNQSEELKPLKLYKKGLFGGDFTLFDQYDINFAGRHWQFEIAPKLAYFAEHTTDSTWLILIGGLILTSLVSAFMMIASGRDSLLRQRVEERTAAYRSAEHQISAQSLRYQTLLKASTDGIHILDANGYIVEFNPAFSRLLGYTQTETQQLNVAQWDAQWSATDLMKILRDLIDCGESKQFETKHRRKDGSIINVEISAAKVDIEDQPLLFCSARDITERKQNEAIILLAKDRAEALAQSKSEFLANMSHEIRTPMNAIIGLSHLALTKQVNPEVRDYIEKIQLSSEGLLGILNDILDFSKIEAGKLGIENIRFDLHDVVDNLYNLHALQTQEKQLKFITDIPDDLPTDLVGDALRIQQILSNLMGNAIKFTAHGSVSLKLQLLSITASRAMIRFCVNDTGIGISADDQAKLFQPFSQADTSITRRFGGSGLGLVICQRLLELMGSELIVISKPGQGSSFCFNLEPGLASLQKYQQLQRRPSNRKTSSLSATLPEQRELLKGRLILVAEDNRINQQVVKEFLEFFGISVTVAQNGLETLQKLNAQAYHAVLMDVHMPEMSGVETTVKIRRQPEFANLPIIALTAGVTQQEREQCLACSMNDFIAKPLNPEELINVLCRWLKQTALPTAVATAQASSTSPAAEDTQAWADLQLTLPEFDLHNIMILLGGRRDSLLRMLKDFADDFAGEASTVVNLLNQQQFVEAKTHLHKLKGVAGNLGALSLSQSSDALDKQLKQGSFSAQSLQEWLKAFNRSLTAISALLDEHSVSQLLSKAHDETLTKHLTELDELLANDDFIDDSLLTAIEQRLSPTQHAIYKNLSRHIYATNYSAARIVLDQLSGAENADG